MYHSCRQTEKWLVVCGPSKPRDISFFAIVLSVVFQGQSSVSPCPQQHALCNLIMCERLESLHLHTVRNVRYRFLRTREVMCQLLFLAVFAIYEWQENCKTYLVIVIWNLKPVSCLNQVVTLTFHVQIQIKIAAMKFGVNIVPVTIFINLRDSN
jgi:hypothetical protein